MGIHILSVSIVQAKVTGPTAKLHKERIDIAAYFIYFSRYYITITAARGSRYKGDIAIDDVSLSPECVGLGKI